MAKHDIEVEIPTQTVKNKDVKVGVRSDGQKWGTVQISKGSIDWKPSPNSKRLYRMSWEKFDEIMRSEGKPT